MTIKSLFSPHVRQSIVRSLSWVPDRMMVPVQYYVSLGRKPHLKHPRRFSEWINWYKLNGRNPDMLRCADKYTVREYLQEKGCGEWLVKQYAHYDTPDQIDFDSLPSKFVIKTSDGGNGDNVMLVRDKSSIDPEEVRKKIESWQHRKLDRFSREWAYSASKSHIIIEELLEDPEHPGETINDYKFLCFGGKCKMLRVDHGKSSVAYRGYWDREGNFLPGHTFHDRKTYALYDTPLPLPSNLKEMVKVAEKISKGFTFVRVDLYNIGGKIYFGETTFYPVSGYMQFVPDSFDFTLGKFFKEAVEEEKK